MKLQTLLMANFSSSDLSDDLWRRLNAVANKVVLAQRTSQEFDQAIKDADGVVLRLGMVADSAFFDSAPSLKYLGMYGTGYGRIDTAEAKQRGVVVANVADYSTESVAELALAMALSSYRNLRAEEDRALSGDVDETEFDGRDVSALSVGVVGAGNIGQRVIKLFAHGIGSTVSYWSRQRRPGLEGDRVNYESLAEICEHCDIVTMHVSSTAETDQLLSGELVRSMKAGSLIINTAPNEVVDLNAILDRCSAGELRFAMDHADELGDAERKRLISSPNVMVVPPIGYATVEAGRRKQEVVVENIEAFLNGSPQNHVNP